MEHSLNFERIDLLRHFLQLDEIVDENAALAEAVDADAFVPAAEVGRGVVDFVQLRKVTNKSL